MKKNIFGEPVVKVKGYSFSGYLLSWGGITKEEYDRNIDKGKDKYRVELNDK